MSSKPSILLQCFLFPLSLIYAFIVGVRNRLFDLRILSSHTFDIPIIVVGNITVGGTGKTPHIEYLVHLLQSRHHVTVLSRGYKRETQGFLKATSSTSWREIGDEPYQILQKHPGLEIVVDEKRVRGIRNILTAKRENQVILLDDGYQHRSVSAGLNILLIDHAHPIDKDFYLPYGRLRESSCETRRAKIIVITKCPQQMTDQEKQDWLQRVKPQPFQEVFFTTLHYEAPKPLFYIKGLRSVEKDFFDNVDSIVLVTGIADPSSLIHYLENRGKRIYKHDFPDHYLYKTSDIQKICNTFDAISGGNKIILTTEKDAVRIVSLDKEGFPHRDKWYVLPVKVGFSSKTGQEKFNKIIRNYAEEN